MTSWVEDIIQALKNLGGQASLNQIYAEIERIRKVPLTKNWHASIRERIEAHSSDSHNFKGKDFFHKVDRGIWALRDRAQIEKSPQVNSEFKITAIHEYLPPESIEEISKENKMENYELIQDTGLFVGQKLFEFSLTESFESITNLFQTIKEYREFANPDEAADWFEYVHQFFQIFGFNTIKVAQRLITLQEMGANQPPKALVYIIGPKEDFNQIIFGLDWESYLFYTAKFHQVEWVILTNGLQFKVLNYANDANEQRYFKCELDEIIKNGKVDSFFTLYKIFSVINRGTEEKRTDHTGVDKIPNKKGKRVLVERHHLRREFWTQLLSRSKGQTKLFDQKKSPGVENYLNVGGGKKGIYYQYIITIEGGRVELYIDNGHGNWNKSVFDSFSNHKQEIEDVFGDSLVWERLDDKRACVIRYSLDQFGIKDKDKWAELQDQMIETMIRFEKAFRPFIKQLD